MAGKKETTARPTLNPVDFTRCQCFEREGSFMTLWPRSMRRCDAPPTHVAVEREPGADGLIGAMSLCPRHVQALGRFHQDRATLFRILAVKGQVLKGK